MYKQILAIEDLFFLLLNSVYTVLPLSQGLDIGLKGEQYI